MRTKITLLAAFLGLLFGCQQIKTDDSPKIEKGMIHVAILYPNGEGKTFDIDYYANKHMPLVKSLPGDSVKITSIDKGLPGAPDAPAPYLAVGHLYFETMSAFQNSMPPSVTDKLSADVPNYTNIEPIIVISEVQQ